MHTTIYKPLAKLTSSTIAIAHKPRNIDIKVLAIDYNTLYITTEDTIVVYATDGEVINEDFYYMMDSGAITE